MWCTFSRALITCSHFLFILRLYPCSAFHACPSVHYFVLYCFCPKASESRNCGMKSLKPWTNHFFLKLFVVFCTGTERDHVPPNTYWWVKKFRLYLYIICSHGICFTTIFSQSPGLGWLWAGHRKEACKHAQAYPILWAEMESRLLAAFGYVSPPLPPHRDRNHSDSPQAQEGILESGPGIPSPVG